MRRVGPPLRTHGPMVQIAEFIAEVWNWDSAAAAGGICTTPIDWAKWIAVRLAMGKLPDGTRLYLRRRGPRRCGSPTSSSSGSEGPTAALPGRAIASTYAMGYQVQDYRGERLISHGGGSPGGISATVHDPGPQRRLLDLHQRRGELPAARPALAASPTSSWARPASTGSRLAAAGRRERRQGDHGGGRRSTRNRRPARRRPCRWTAYAGTWRDPWYGDIVIEPMTDRAANARAPVAGLHPHPGAEGAAGAL